MKIVAANKMKDEESHRSTTCRRGIRGGSRECLAQEWGRYNAFVEVGGRILILLMQNLGHRHGTQVSV